MNPFAYRITAPTRSLTFALALAFAACAGKETRPDEKVAQPAATPPAEASAALPAGDGPPTGAVGQVTIGDKAIPVTQANAREVLGALLEKPHSTLGDLGLVFFSHDSDALSDESKRGLGDVATALKASPELHLRLGGHADERGGDGYNDALSLRRARTVQAFLVQRGVAEAQLEAAAYGVRHPLDPSHTIAAYARNRRCELRLPEAQVTAQASARGDAQPAADLGGGMVRR